MEPAIKKCQLFTIDLFAWVEFLLVYLFSNPLFFSQSFVVDGVVVKYKEQGLIPQCTFHFLELNKVHSMSHDHYHPD